MEMLLKKIMNLDIKYVFAHISMCLSSSRVAELLFGLRKICLFQFLFLDVENEKLPTFLRHLALSNGISVRFLNFVITEKNRVEAGQM